MYKTILLYLPTTQSAQAVATAAAQMAQQHGATLVGLHPVIRFTVYGGISEDIAAQLDERDRKAADAIKFVFEDLAVRHKLAHEWRSWRARDVDAFRDLAAQCRTADLVVAPGKDFHDPLGHWFDMPERLALETGRPLLLVPRGLNGTGFGRRIMVAWNGSREAARAAFDALPLLRAAESVSILTVADRLENALAASAKDFAAALRRQGLKAELAFAGASRKPDGEVILDNLADWRCDMLVMGFYGHSRLREIVWGGPTRHILEKMNMPVFTSH
jgi:nucleotide-binding universal stress UspA family protein